MLKTVLGIIRNNVYMANATRNLTRKSSRCNNTIPTLYYDERSPPARFALMTAKYLNIQVNIEEIDLFKGQQYSEEFKRVNPLQKVPVLKHGDIAINDSHAIAIYLCEQFDDGNQLYPKSPTTRALINSMLFYNNGTVFPIDSSIMSKYFAGSQKIDAKLKEALTKELAYLDQHMKDKQWLVGDNFTLADIGCAATLTTVDLLVPITENEFYSVFHWLEACKNLPVFKINEKGLNSLTKCINEYRVAT